MPRRMIQWLAKLTSRFLRKGMIYMSVIRPFKAIRPTPALAAKVAALPYDVMNSSEAREMVKGNPHSFLYVDRPEIGLNRDIPLYDPRVYRQAADHLQKMIDTGTLIQDETPSLYIYRLTMDGRPQTGLVACTSIDEYQRNLIKKHELTREEKEQDRIRHIEACDANTGPIFLAHRAKESIDRLIDDFTAKNCPIYDFVAEDGIGHTVWIINDTSVMDTLIAEYKAVPSLYIADGHHRNASAVKVGLKKREQAPDCDESAEHNYYLSVIFSDNQLYIMDYNRVVKFPDGLTDKKFIGRVSEKFDVAPFDGGCYTPEKAHTFGMYWQNRWYKLTAKPEIVDDTDPVASLDVSILQNHLLAPILEIGDPRTDKNIDFVGGVRGLDELERRVDSGEMQVAFAMFPTSMDELMAIADRGQCMPPKSTWFEPKLRSGLFIHKLT